jgi:hypothetical protein
MLDNDIQLMISIFHKAYQLEGAEERDPMKYLMTYKSDIEEAGPLFACLGLAEPDTQSPLGWRPTPALMEIIANRAARFRKKLDRRVTAADRVFKSLLRDVAFGEGHHSDRAFCAFSVLRALGLVREAFDGDVPTLQLGQLLAEAYHDRRAKRGKPKKLVMGLANKVFYRCNDDPVGLQDDPSNR